MKKLAILLCALISVPAFSKVTVQTDNRVEILAVNQAINDVPNIGRGDLQIENGENQLLIRVTAMIDTNGGKEKFSSLPMVVKFNASDETLKFETPYAIRDNRGVTRFKRAPEVKVTSSKGAIDVVTDNITNQTFDLIKDYNAMLANYNREGGVAAITAAPVQLPEVAPVPVHPIETAVSSKQTKPMVKPSQLQKDFMAMTPEQRQEFVSWAVKNMSN
ncbi:DUF2057 family protein [Vibrio mexicanus]|uniref:DUF2057 family protein n=1 Tax=Vibrio mexicanus TaxID=1004326 RepID=UPI00063CE608|nr:DUF2057 family protein [Vibrio mexicanus]